MCASADRRTFLGLAGAGVVAAMAGEAWAAKPKAAAKPKVKAEKVPPPPPKKYPLKLGLATYSLRKFTLDQTLAMARQVQLQYLCLKSMHLPLDSTPEQIAAAVAKVKAAGLTLYGAGVISMRDAKEVEQAFPYAKAAGMTTIVAAPVAEMLPLINDKIQQFDIRVAIHNHGPGDKHFPTPQSAYDKIKTLDRRFGLCIDIGHTLRIGACPIADAERYADRLFDVHIKDVTAATPQGTGIQVGRGVIDIPRFLRTLKKIGYQDVVSFEYEQEPDDPMPGLAESVGYTRGVMATM
jgi:inosose dehydratase